METLGKRARTRRRELGLTQKRIAAACGVTQQAYEKLEAGGVSRPRYLPELADILQTSPGWLLTGMNEKPGVEKKHAAVAGRIPVYNYLCPEEGPHTVNWESDVPIDYVPPLPGMENAAQTAVLYIQDDCVEPFYSHGHHVYINRAKRPSPGMKCVYEGEGSLNFAHYTGHERGTHIFMHLSQNKPVKIPAAKIKGVYMIVGVLYV